MWQRCGTNRPDLDPGATLQPVQRIGTAVAVEVADQLRVGVTKPIGGQLVVALMMALDGSRTSPNR
jgi:hypothetical protein